VRLLDISGDNLAEELTATFTYQGKYTWLEMQANRSALVLTAENSDPGTNYLFRVDSTNTGSIDSVELIGVINNADIDHWTADNFAF